MSSLRKGGFRFFAYSNDHNPPHVDVRKDRGKLKIYLGVDGQKPRMGPRTRMSDVDAKRAFQTCCDYHDEMIELWEKVHGNAENG